MTNGAGRLPNLVARGGRLIHPRKLSPDRPSDQVRLEDYRLRFYPAVTAVASFWAVVMSSMKVFSAAPQVGTAGLGDLPLHANLHPANQVGLGVVHVVTPRRDRCLALARSREAHKAMTEVPGARPRSPLPNLCRGFNGVGLHRQTGCRTRRPA